MSTDYQFAIDETDDSEWDVVLAGFHDANVYQTRASGHSGSARERLSCLVVRQAGTVVAAAQVRLEILPVVGAGIAYVRWGPLWRSIEHDAGLDAFKTVLDAVREEYAERRGLLVRIVPTIFATDAYADAAAAILNECGFKRCDSRLAYRTLRLQLASPLSDIRSSLDPKWRDHLIRAERNELVVREGTTTELFATFLTLYDQMFARKRFESTVDPHRFRRVQDALSDSTKLQIRICEKDGEALNGLVTTDIGATGICLFSATNDPGMKLQGSYLLQWKTIESMKAKGCHYYDLGGINPEANPGVYRFKSGLAGDDISQLGTFEYSVSGLSRAVVGAGERWRRGTSMIRRKRPSSQPAPPRAGSASF